MCYCCVFVGRVSAKQKEDENFLDGVCLGGDNNKKRKKNNTQQENKNLNNTRSHCFNRIVICVNVCKTFKGNIIHARNYLNESVSKLVCYHQQEISFIHSFIQSKREPKNKQQ